MRNYEMNAVLGLEQLKRLDHNIRARQSNLHVWLDNLNSKKYFTDYNRIGNSNFSLPLILKNRDKDLLLSICNLLETEKVEYRTGTAGGGNQARQPYLKNYSHKIFKTLETVDHIHDYSLYIGNQIYYYNLPNLHKDNFPLDYLGYSCLRRFPKITII